MASRRSVSGWGPCGTRGFGPPAQWLSLPFYAPEGAWRLSWQIPGIHRGLPKGRSLWIRDQAELYRLSAAHWLSLPFYTPEGAWPLSPLAPAASSRWFSATGPCQVGVNRATSASFACIGASVPSSSLPSPRGAPGHSDRPRRSRPDPSLPPHRHYLRRCHYQSPQHHHHPPLSRSPLPVSRWTSLQCPARRHRSASTRHHPPRGGGGAGQYREQVAV